jgi:hypothetical protein
MEDTNKTQEVDQKLSLEEAKKTYTKDSPHPTGAYWDEGLQKWKGYKAKKGFNPPWNPWSRERRKRVVTINEKKFLMVLSQTGSLAEAFRAVYKYGSYPDKRIENARIRALAEQVLRRIKGKAPDLVAAFTFDDITPDYIKKEMMKLYSHDHATIGEKTRLLELMGKTQAMFTDKVVTDQKIREVIDPVYTESDDDFIKHGRVDERKNLVQIVGEA